MSRLLSLSLTLSTAVAFMLTTSLTLTAADEKPGHKDHGHGDMIAVGSVTLGSIVAKVEGAGAPAAGKEWHVTVDLPAGTTAPKAIRLWVGIENGRGSEKAKAEAETDHPSGYAAHVDVPAPMPEGSKLWVSLETAAGETTKASVALPAAGKADDHKGHEHKK